MTTRQKTRLIGGTTGLIHGAALSALVFLADTPPDRWAGQALWVGLCSVSTLISGAGTADVVSNIIVNGAIRRRTRAGVAALGAAIGVPVGAVSGAGAGWVIGFVAAALICPGDGQAIFLPIFTACISSAAMAVGGISIGATAALLTTGSYESDR